MRPPALFPGIAVFLDVDGTLLDLADHPMQACAGPELQRLLDDLEFACGGALALISGRSIEDIERLFFPRKFAAAGQHGTELRLVSGSLRRHSPSIEKLGWAAAEIVGLTAAHHGLLFENKGMTLALHYRMAPHLQEMVRQQMLAIAAHLGDEFELQEGKFLYEVKPSGKDKGTAIAEFMVEAPFTGRLPVFVGDDLSDEYGFEAVNALGGHSVKVGPGATRARWRLDDAASVLVWLGEFAASGGRTRKKAQAS